MTDALTNFIQITGDKLTGNIATLTFDIDITGQRNESDNDRAPAFRIYAQSPRGRKIEIGAIWENLNTSEQPYYALSLNTGTGKFYANLGRYPGQDDHRLYAVIPNDFRNATNRQ